MKKLLVVGTFVAGVTVGFTACGMLVVNRVLKSDRHREGLVGVISEKMEKWLYGEEKHEWRYASNSRVSYKTFHDQKYCTARYLEQIIFETREKAESVLSEIEEWIGEHGYLSVHDLYELCEVPSDHVDSEYGWKSVNDMGILRTYTGYKIYLPKPIKL